MGCTQSKIENEEIVNRCKERKSVMKDSVSARNAFAAAHFSYAAALKNTGAALSDYAQGEVEFPDHHRHPSSNDVVSSSSILPPAPPQPPPLYESPPPPPPPHLQRAATMPEFSVSEPELRPGHHPDPIIEEVDEDDEIADRSLKHRSRSGSRRSGGAGERRETVKEDFPPPSPPQPTPPPRPMENNNNININNNNNINNNHNNLSRAAPPPPMSHGMSSWDYFFTPMEHVTGSTLSDIDHDNNNNNINNININNNNNNNNNRYEQEDIQRKVMEEQKHKQKHNSVENEEEEEEEDDDEDEDEDGVIHDDDDVAHEVVEEEEELPPPRPKAEKKVRVSVPVSVPAPAPAEGRRSSGKGGGQGLNLLQIFIELDDCFLQASESASEVSKMLEANRLHYHSNFADSKRHIDHSARVMRVITWNRSFKGLPEVDDKSDDFDSEENETHATVLDKMLAWEKKLYDEVKAGELMKFEYQKKIASLNRLKKRGASTEHLERTKATVSHLHTRYIVDMQSMDSTVSEINRLRDEQLYPKLVQLVDGMALMWGNMSAQHDKQSKIVQALRSLDISHSPKETSEHHYNNTRQLHVHVQMWHSQFEKLMLHQKEYIKSLNNWLKLNLIPIDNNLREKVSSPQRPQTPPIQTLLRTWHDFLEKLPEEGARTAINNFAAVMDTIFQYQTDEMKMKERCEETRRELTRKARKFEEWYNKYMQKRADEEIENDKEVIAEQQITVELLKKRLEEEEEAYQRQCVQVRDKSLMNLKTGLPEVFRAMYDFSRGCSNMYKSLSSRTRPQRSNASLS